MAPWGLPTAVQRSQHKRVVFLVSSRDSKTSQELRMLSSVTLNCQVFIVMDSGFQL